MAQQEKEYYQQIRKRFEDEQKIAGAVKWAIYIGGMVVCWVWRH